ncbi:MAG: hypothetical protein AAGJ46_08300 [Planctomycetota bacterium]
MSITVTVRDETAAGDAYHQAPLELPSERVTVRELLRARVYQEVQDYNQQQGDQAFRGLVQPTDAERVLNGGRAEYRMKKPRQIDWKTQFEKAQAAFEENAFLVLAGDQQAAKLDEELAIAAGEEVAFVKLTPLVGG